MRNLLRVDRLEALAGLPASRVTDVRTWLERLSNDDAWRVLGAVTAAGMDEESAATDPRERLRNLLSHLEDELASWLRHPVEVIEYFLASTVVLERDGAGSRWHWTETHRAIWADRHGGPAPESEPVGIRVLPLTSASLEKIVQDRLGPALPALFKRLEADATRGERVVGRISRVCREVLGRSEDEVLGPAGGAFRSLAERSATARGSNEAWRAEALRCVKALIASLPEGLQEREAPRLHQLREAVLTYAPPALVVAVPPGTMSDPVEFEHGHFLNNWD